MNPPVVRLLDFSNPTTLDNWSADILVRAPTTRGGGDPPVGYDAGADGSGRTLVRSEAPPESGLFGSQEKRRRALRAEIRSGLILSALLLRPQHRLPKGKNE